MPKLILRCNYLKNAPPSHLENFMTYIGTRDGVEKVESTTANLPPTARQEDLIQDILRKIHDAGRIHEYYDYLQRPTRENASEFITQALENNLDIIAKKKNYMDYLANRPGVERTGTHGLFSNEGESIVLSRVADEVANHTGVVWTNVISLQREDAERLGYDSAAQWQALLQSRVELLCENYKIDSRNLKWYAAFHNESHHPHVHLVVYSTKPSEGYLTKKGIETMRSAYAHDIFRQEFMSIYEPIGGCIACLKCGEKGCCVFDDAVNRFREKAYGADGFVFGSPVHYAGATGNMTAFMDRLFYSELRGNGNKAFYMKPAAAVVSARRAGTTVTFDQLNKYFTIQEMPVVSSRYWNMIHGANAEQARQDAEGLYTMRVLGRNMAYMLRCKEVARKVGVELPEQETPVFTNFIR